MNKDIHSKYELRAKIMKALGHPTRLFIVDELGREPRFVHELTKMIGANVSTVSKHLNLLKEAGVVDYEKLGTQVRYRLAAPCVLDFFTCMESMVKPCVGRILKKSGSCLEVRKNFPIM